MPRQPGCTSRLEPTSCDAKVVGALARALGQPWQQYAERLLAPMALTGLSEELVDAMCQVQPCHAWDKG